MPMYIQITNDGHPASNPIFQENLEAAIGPLTPENLSKHGYTIIHNFDPPMVNIGQQCERGEIVRNGRGEIEQIWTITDIPVDEKIRRWVLGPRELRLMRSDWTQVADAPLSAEDKEKWRLYRQELRDMTKKYDWASMTSPEFIEWPKEPFPIDDSKYRKAVYGV